MLNGDGYLVFSFDGQYFARGNETVSRSMGEFRKHFPVTVKMRSCVGASVCVRMVNSITGDKRKSEGPRKTCCGFYLISISNSPNDKYYGRFFVLYKWVLLIEDEMMLLECFFVDRRR